MFNSWWNWNPSIYTKWTIRVKNPYIPPFFSTQKSLRNRTSQKREEKNVTLKPNTIFHISTSASARKFRLKHSASNLGERKNSNRKAFSLAECASQCGKMKIELSVCLWVEMRKLSSPRNSKKREEKRKNCNKNSRTKCWCLFVVRTPTHTHTHSLASSLCFATRGGLHEADDDGDGWHGYKFSSLLFQWNFPSPSRCFFSPMLSGGRDDME